MPNTTQPNDNILPNPSRVEEVADTSAGARGEKALALTAAPLSITFPLTWSPPPCKGSAGDAAEADHAMVCNKGARMSQMRHDNLANALRLVISACSCQLPAEPRYSALSGKKGMGDCQCWGDIVAVLPRRDRAAVDVVVAHAYAKSYAAQAAKESGWTTSTARAERTKRTRFRQDVLNHAAFWFVPLAVETCGYMGKGAVRFVNRLADIAAESGRIPNGNGAWQVCICVLHNAAAVGNGAEGEC